MKYGVDVVGRQRRMTHLTGWCLPQPHEEKSTAQHVYCTGLTRADRRNSEVVTRCVAFASLARAPLALEPLITISARAWCATLEPVALRRQRSSSATQRSCTGSASARHEPTTPCTPLPIPHPQSCGPPSSSTAGRDLPHSIARASAPPAGLATHIGAVRSAGEFYYVVYGSHIVSTTLRTYDVVWFTHSKYGR